MKQYLGINIGTHDSSVCHVTITDESVDVTVFEEERFSREKHKGLFPYASIARLVNEVDVTKIPATHVGATSFMDTLLESYANSEKKLFFRDFVDAKNCGLLTAQNEHLKHITHHEAHLFSVLPQVAEELALIVVADSCGSPMLWGRQNSLFPYPAGCDSRGHENVSVYLKRGSNIECVLKVPTQHLINGACDADIASEVYCKTADFVFGHWFHCGKLMGLAAYHQGAVLSKEALLKALEEDEYAPIKTKEKFDALTGEQFAYMARLAASAQAFFEDWFYQLFQKLKTDIPEATALYFTGGSALNCLLNTKVVNDKLFRKFHCVAFPNDEGVAIGAALAAAFKKGDYVLHKQFMSPSAYLGSKGSIATGEKLRDSFKNFDVRMLQGDYQMVANQLNGGDVVAWVHGRSECGPRALGHRSLLASAFTPGIKQQLNNRYKHRESFRPYGISILAEDVARYFEVEPGFQSPYMSFTPTVRVEYRDLLKEVIQPDNSLRVQTVTGLEPELEALLVSYKAISGHGILLHTSLNEMGKPIVETTQDVSLMLNEGSVKYLVINELFVTSEKKP